MSNFVTRKLNRFPVMRLFLSLPAAAILVVCVSGADKDSQGKGKGSEPAPGQARTQELPKDGAAAIRATAGAFVKAFNAGDAKGVASLWTPNGTLVDEDGNSFKGRKAIEEQFAALFLAHPSAKIEVAIKSIDLPTPTTAIEDGVGEVRTKDNAPPSASRYTAIHVQEDGKWLMASVHESALPVSSSFAKLQALSWLAGNWEATSDDAKIQSKIRWIANKSFLQRDFAVHQGGIVASSGTQIIGWDPQSEQILSWTFNSSGGRGMGRWTATPDGWVIESSGVTADAVPTTSKDFVVRVPGDDNVLGWHSVDRRRGDTKLPNAAEVVLDRVPPKK